MGIKEGLKEVKQSIDDRIYTARSNGESMAIIQF